VGREILAGLLADASVAAVHSLGRRKPVIEHRKLTSHVVDFTALPALPPANEAYLALGTTIKVAGSQAAFRAVDYDANLFVARAALAAGVKRVGLVSAMGADARSKIFYSRVKGELEDALAQLVIVGMQRHRDVMHLRREPGRMQALHEFIARHAVPAEGDADEIEVVRARLAARALRRPDQPLARESLVVGRHQGAAPLDEAVQLVHLRQAERRLDLGQAIVEAELLHLVVPAVAPAVGERVLLAQQRVRPLVDAVAAQSKQVAIQALVVGRDHSALAGRDVLDRMEGEHRHVRLRAGAYARAVRVAGAKRVRGILDDHGAVAPGDRLDRAHVARQAGKVHRDHGGHAPRLAAAPLEVFGVQVESIGPNVGKRRARPDVVGAIRAGDEGHRAGDDAVARPGAGRGAGQMERRGAAGHSNGMARADIAGDLLLELFDRTALREGAFAKLPHHGLDVFLVQEVLAVGNHRRHTVTPAASSARASKRDLTSMPTMATTPSLILSPRAEAAQSPCAAPRTLPSCAGESERCCVTSR
jgi:hypothetical protein